MLIAAHDDGLVASHERSATGVIVSHEPQSHNRYAYQFEVDGIGFTGWETLLKDEPRIGQQVKVYFDSRNPSENSLTDFSVLSDTWRGRAIVLLIFSALFAGSIILFDLTVGKARSRRANPSTHRSA